MAMKLIDDAFLNVHCYPDDLFDSRLYRKGDIFTGIDTCSQLGYFTAYEVNGFPVISEFSEDCEIHIPINLLEDLSYDLFTRSVFGG